jgi:hypothetical protein
MITRDIEQFNEIKSSALSYFCYLFSKNIAKTQIAGNDDSTYSNVKKGLYRIYDDIKKAQRFYIVDKNGLQIEDAISRNKMMQYGNDEDFSTEPCFTETILKRKCALSNPYPSSETSDMIITASYPVYDEDNILLYVVMFDIELKKLLTLIHPSSSGTTFGILNKITYSIISMALAAVSLLLFIQGINDFLAHGYRFWQIEIEEIFTATILLTLSLAIFDLVKTIVEEEVLGNRHKSEHNEIHKTMVRFLGSIIIALSIESLMLVFKFAITGPEKIIYAIYILLGVAVLLISLAAYVKIIGQSEKN